MRAKIKASSEKWLERKRKSSKLVIKKFIKKENETLKPPKYFDI